MAPRKTTATPQRISGSKYRLKRGDKNVQVWFTEDEWPIIEEATKLDGRPKANALKHLAMEWARGIVRAERRREKEERDAGEKKEEKS